MKLHANHRTCPSSRRADLRGVCSSRAGRSRRRPRPPACSERTAAKWLARYRGRASVSCSIAPRGRKRIPHRTAAERVRGDRGLRRLRMTAAEIAEILGVALSTVSLWLKRIGLGKRSRLEPPEPPNRYERRQPGRARARRHQEARPDLARRRPPRDGHRASQTQPARRPPARRRRLGVRARMVDDHSRLAYAEVLDDAQRQLRRRLPAPSGRLVCRARRAGRSGDDRQRLLLVAHAYAAACASSDCATCGPGPADPAPTARPSASSRPSSTSGPTAASTAAQPNAPQALPLFLEPLQLQTTTRLPRQTRRRPRG